MKGVLIAFERRRFRALMEMKTLDFYNHDAYCSAKCQSRNYITSKSFAADLVMNQEVYHGASTSNGFDSRESINCRLRLLVYLLLFKKISF